MEVARLGFPAPPEGYPSIERAAVRPESDAADRALVLSIVLNCTRCLHPVAKAEELVARIPNVEPLAFIAGAGHAANLTFPDETNAAIRPFLDALP